jgi:hypothetical protein
MMDSKGLSKQTEIAVPTKPIPVPAAKSTVKFIVTVGYAGYSLMIVVVAYSQACLFCRGGSVHLCTRQAGATLCRHAALRGRHRQMLYFVA